MRRDKAVRLVKRLGAAFPGQAMEEGTTTEYVRVLNAWPDKAGDIVIDRAIETSGFRPSVSDLIRLKEQLDRPVSAFVKMIPDVMRRRGVDHDEARESIIGQLKDNHRDNPDGPWAYHLEAFGVSV